jgi:uncharacterized protein (DUF433 family)
VHDLTASLVSLRDLSGRRRFGRIGRMPASMASVSPSVSTPDVSRGLDVTDQTESDDPSGLVATASLDVSDLWRERLVLDPEVCATSPVVRGTRITVRHVVSLVVDGWSWAAIRHQHSDLDDADIRACLAYCVEEEGGGVSYD